MFNFNGHNLIKIFMGRKGKTDYLSQSSKFSTDKNSNTYKMWNTENNMEISYLNNSITIENS